MNDIAPATGKTLTEQLEWYSVAALKQIARNLGVTPAGADRAAYTQALAAVLGTPHHRQVLEHHVPAELWAVLGLLSVRLGSFKLRVLVGALWQRGVQGRAALEMAAGLLGYGCLLPVGGLPGSNRLGVDADALASSGLPVWLEAVPAVRSWALEHGAALSLTPVGPPPAAVGAALPEFQRAAFVVLTEASRKAIRVTAQGDPYKADLSRLGKALAAGKERAAPSAGAATMPAVLWFALAALFGARVLELQRHEFRPSDEAKEFFNKPLAEQVGRLLAGWTIGPFDDFLCIPTLQPSYSSRQDPWVTASTYTGAGSPGLDRLSQARLLVGAAVREATAAAPDAWYRIDDLARLVFEQHPEFLYERWNDYELYHVHQFASALQPKQQRRAYYGLVRRGSNVGASRPTAVAQRQLYHDTDWLEVEGALVRQVVAESLRWLGLVEVGPTAESPDRFRLSALGQHVLGHRPLAQTEAAASGRVIVQPNFDVIVVDAAASMGLLVQLDDFAERRNLDRAATYRLTQAALVRGLDQGWTGERVVATLETASGGPLPQNVRYSLQDWVRLYEGVSLREAATLLEADHPGQLDSWLADRVLAPLLGERLSGAAVLVPARHLLAAGQRVAELNGELRTVNYALPPTGVLRVGDPDLIEVEVQHLEPYLRYRLETFSVPAGQADHRSRYRVTRETVERAAAAGWKGEQMVQFLATAAGQPLPAEVVSRLWGWSGGIPALSYEPLIAVVLPTAPVTWAVLRQIPAIAKRIRAIPTQGLALVAPADLAPLRAELEARGLGLTERQHAAEPLKGTAAPDGLAAHLFQALVNPLTVLGGLAQEESNALLEELQALNIPTRKGGPRRSS